MNPILNDELVRRYFGCCTDYNDDDHNCRELTALRVLDALTTKINKGDRYLSLSARARSAEYMAYENWDGMWHPNALRLPSEHQEPDYEKELADRARHYEWCACEHKELIDLARKAERQTLLREQRGEMERENELYG